MAVSTVPFPDAEGKKKKGVLPRTLRFDLVLEDSTEESTNEYSYAHLVNDALKGSNDSVSEEDPLASDTVDTKLARIARQLEEKYGSAAKKRRIIHDADFINLGCGYDTEDSFVDDSEAIDDFVPPHMETAQGGFYINQGDLQFKKSTEIDPDSDYDFSTAKKSLPPKLIRQPSTSTTLASQKVKQAKKVMLGKKGLHVGHPRKTSHGDTSHSSGHIKNKVKKFGGENKVRKKATLAPKGEPPSSPSPTVVEPKESASDKSPATGSGQASLSVGTSSSVKSESPSKTSKTADAVSPISSENEGDGSLQEAVKGSPPPLPRDLPDQLLSKIEDLKQAFAKETAGDKKLSIKGRQMLDTQMIEIEKDCGKNLTVKTRTGVYDHIAGVMNVKRASIMSRTVKTMKKREEEKLSMALNLLKKDVDLRMVTQMKKYEDEVMIANLCASGPVGGSPSSERMDTSVPGTVGDENSTISTISSASSLHNQPAKAKKVRKHFKWDAEIKQHLLNVVTIKINEVTSQRKLTGVDDLVGRYLDECVKPLWPKGWMSKGILLKMSESAYKHLLPVQDQPLKKPVSVQSASVSNTTKVTSTIAATSTTVPSSTTASTIKQPSLTTASTIKQSSSTAASTINQLSLTAASTISTPSLTAVSTISTPSLTAASTIDSPSLTAASTISTPSLTAASTIDSPSQCVGSTISTPPLTTTTVSQMPSIILTPITTTSTISSLSSVDSTVRITTVARKPILTSAPTDSSRSTSVHPVVSSGVTVDTPPGTGNTSDKASSPQILAGPLTQEKAKGLTLSLKAMAQVKDLLSNLKDLPNYTSAPLSVASTLLKMPSISPTTSHSETVTPILSPKIATSPNFPSVSKSSSAITTSHSQFSKPISTSQQPFSTLHPRGVVDTKESSKGIVKKEPIKRLSTKEPKVRSSPLSSSSNSSIFARSQSSANDVKSLISSWPANHSAEIVQTMSPLQATLQQSSPRVSQSSQILSEHSYQVSPTSVDGSSVSVGGVGRSDSLRLTSGLQPLSKDKVDPSVLEEDAIH